MKQRAFGIWKKLGGQVDLFVMSAPEKVSHLDFQTNRGS
jgi:hypothetical protein